MNRLGSWILGSLNIFGRIFFSLVFFWISLHTLSAGVSHSRHDGSFAPRDSRRSRRLCMFLEFRSECFDSLSFSFLFFFFLYTSFFDVLCFLPRSSSTVFVIVSCRRTSHSPCQIQHHLQPRPRPMSMGHFQRGRSGRWNDLSQSIVRAHPFPFYRSQ